MPSPHLVVAIQFTLGLIIFGTVFHEYVLGNLLSHGRVLYALVKRNDELSGVSDMAMVQR